MKHLSIALFFIVTHCVYVSGQCNDISIYYGRFYTLYNYKDYGSGFKNLPKSQFNFYPSVALNTFFSKKISVETKVSFMAYEQYTGTRLYSPGFASSYLVGNLSLTGNYTFFSTLKWESRIKAGMALGIVPDKYKGEFTEMFVFPYTDSISRGTINRDFRTFFPAFSTGFDVSYNLGKGFKAVLAGSYQKAFLRISEYDIYYNDGSGNNDQHAKQWGNGSFYGFQLGLRYLLKKRKDK